MNLTYSNCLSIIDNFKKINIDQSRLGKENDYNLITHAHSDHIHSSKQKTFTTKETSKLISLQLDKPLDYFFLNSKPFQLTDNITLQSLNAGHILGSKMFFFENKNTSLLYTGDFKTKDSLLFSGAKPVQADTLVIETTFGKKNFTFPERETIYNDFSEMLKKDISKNKLILIGAYSLGKTQEIITFLNKFLNETALVTKKAFEFSKVYEENSLVLGNYVLLDHNINDYNILITPINLINKHLIKSLEHQQNRKVVSYFITGWNYNRLGKTIPISDHCDYNDLLEFVKEVNPKQVFTTHGFSEEFSKTITKEIGIFSKPLSSLKN